MNVIPGNPKQQAALYGAVDNNSLSSAYLFIGNEGIGKETVAIEVANRANNHVGSFEKALESGFLKYLFPFPKGKSKAQNNPMQSLSDKQVDEIKELYKLKNQYPFAKILPNDTNGIKIDQARYQINELKKTSSSIHRFLVVPDVDMMNQQTSNAFLKTLEEPPENTTIILTTSRPKDILDTIHSRCQKVIFTPPSRKELELFVAECDCLNQFDEEQKLAAITKSDGSIVKVLSELLSERVNFYRMAIEFLRHCLRPDNYQIPLLAFINTELKTLDKNSSFEFYSALARLILDSKHQQFDLLNEFVSSENKQIIKTIAEKFGVRISQTLFQKLELPFKQLEVNVAKDLVAFGSAMSIRESMLGK